MLLDPDTLIRDFVRFAAQRNWFEAIDNLIHERQLAPHRPHSLPLGKSAAYMFSLTAQYGAFVPAGPRRLLKAGKNDVGADDIYGTRSTTGGCNGDNRRGLARSRS